VGERRREAESLHPLSICQAATRVLAPAETPHPFDQPNAPATPGGRFAFLEAEPLIEIHDPSPEGGPYTSCVFLEQVGRLVRIKQAPLGTAIYLTRAHAEHVLIALDLFLSQDEDEPAETAPACHHHRLTRKCYVCTRSPIDPLGDGSMRGPDEPAREPNRILTTKAEFAARQHNPQGELPQCVCPVGAACGGQPPFSEGRTFRCRLRA
jgi:hypothetical protein